MSTQNEIAPYKPDIGLLVHTVEAIIWEADFVDARLRFVSGHVVDLLGYSLDEWMNQHSLFMDICHPDDLPRIARAKALSSPENPRYEVIYRLRHKDGYYLWLSDRVCVDFENDVPVRLRGISTDVSERRRIEEALALVVEVIAEASELENVEDISLHCITRICQLGNWQIGQAWLPSIEGHELRCSNQAFFSTIKAAAFREESLATHFEFGQGLPGQTAVSTFPVFVEDVSLESRPTLAMLTASGIKSGFAFAVRNNQKVMAVFEFYGATRARPDKYFLNAIEEIGTHLAVVFERRAAQEMLSLQRAHEQMILDSIPALIFYKDRDNRIVRVNRAVAELHGTTPEAMVGVSCFDIYPNEAVKYFQDDLEVMNTGRPKLGIVEPLITFDGFKHWVVTDKIPFKDPRGQIIGVLCFCSDITQLKSVEEELKAAHADLEDKVAQRTHELNEANIFFTLSRDLLSIADTQGNFRRINNAWVDKLGYSEEEILSRPYMALVHPDDYDKTVAVAEGLARGLSVTNFENRYICKDGSIVWLLWSAVISDTRDFVYACAYDITDRKASESELLDITTALQNAVEGIAKIDIDHCFLSANQSFSQLHGSPSEALISRSILDFIYNDDLPKFRRCFEEMLTKNKAETELLGQTADGALFHEAITLVKVRDVTGNYSGYYIFNKDISARKLVEATLQQSEARFSQLAAHVPGGIYQLLYRRDGTQTFPYVSPTFETILSVGPSQIMADSSVAFDMVHPDDIDRMMADTRTSYETLCNFEFEGRMVTPRGLRWVRIVSSPELLDSGDVMFNGLMTDITEKKVADEEIRKLNADLSERVDSLASVNKELELLTRKLEIAFDAALEASKLKSEFVANISHEIRTPISAVIGMAELLLDTNLSDEQKQFTNMVRDSAQSLLIIINDILDFSKVEAGRLDLEIVNFELLPLIEDSAELLAASARKKSLDLITYVDPGLPSALMGDPVRIRQILINLISNAVKFTREGQVSVAVEKVDEDEHTITLRFQVTDTGIGISPMASRRLFSPFVQADGSTTRQYGGTGLGLSISKLLAEMMEGALEFSSRENEGSSFWFVAPLGKGLSSKGAPPSISAAVIEDNLPALEVVLDDKSATCQLNVAMFSLSRTMVEVVGKYLDCISIVPQVVPSLESLSAWAQKCGRVQQLLLIDLDSLSLKRDEIEQINNLLASSATQAVFFAHSENATAAFSIQPEKYVLLLKPFHLADLFGGCARLLLGEDKNADGSPLTAAIKDGKSHKEPVRSFAGRADAPRVLIAEDNHVMQEVAMRQLQKLGLRTEVVSDGVAAVAAAKSGQFDLIFMDCQMPEMDGYEATLTIRKEEAMHGGHTPIIAMTASAMKGDRENCIAAGMDDYLSKPVNHEHLLVLLDKWLPSMVKPDQATSGSNRIVQDDENDAPFKPIDFANLERLYGQMDLPYLIDSFLIEAADLTNLMAVKLAESNLLEVARLAHQLKGLAVVMTAAKLADLALTLEAEAKKLEAGRDGEFAATSASSEALALKQAIDEELKSLQEVIEPYMQAQRK